MSKVTKTNENKIFRTFTEKEKNEIFLQIYKEQKPRIELFLHARISNNEVREDIVSETFLKVFQKLETFDPNKKVNNKNVQLTTWVHSIALNCLIDYVRKNSRYTVINESDLNTFDEEQRTFEFKEVSEMTADKQLENNELTDKILTAFEQIRPKQKEVAIQYFIYEKNYNEIAEKLEMPLNTVKVAILRAREVLQSALKFEYARL